MHRQPEYTTSPRWNRRLVLSICLGAATVLAACDPDPGQTATVQHKTLQLDSQKISYYESRGTGHPIVLVHGNSSSGSVFRHQLENELGQAYRVVAVDLPGHGHSAPAGAITDYNLPNYAATVVAVAKELNMEDAVFVGWSLGGHIVLQASKSLPGASGFVIFGTPPLALPPAMDKAFLPNPAMGAAFKATLTNEEATAFAAAFFAPNADIDLEPFVAEILNTDGNARAGLAASIAPDSYLAESHQDEVELVANLGTPLAIFHGQEEQLVSEDYIRALNIPSLWQESVQVIPNAGHAPHWENPERFNDLLNTFVIEATR